MRRRDAPALQGIEPRSGYDGRAAHRVLLQGDADKVFIETDNVVPSQGARPVRRGTRVEERGCFLMAIKIFGRA